MNRKEEINNAGFTLYGQYAGGTPLECFKSGAEWADAHPKSPWISVKEQLPYTDNGQSLYEVLVRTCDGRYNVACNVSVESLAGKGEVTHWMPIPEFNESEK